MLKSRLFAVPVAGIALFGLVGSLLAAGCGGVDERPAVWGYIAPVILAPNCATASCHSEAEAASGLDLSTPDKAYESLLQQQTLISRDVDETQEGEVLNCDDVDVTDLTPQCLSSRPLVTPGIPDQSRLLKMLRAEGAMRMPPDRPLPEADIALIQRWIEEGAEGTD